MADMRTATEALEMASQMTRETSIFRDYVEHFIRRWAPSDPRECAEFVADFMMIQRRMYLDATSPDQRTLELLLKNLPFNFEPKK